MRGAVPVLLWRAIIKNTFIAISRAFYRTFFLKHSFFIHFFINQISLRYE